MCYWNCFINRIQCIFKKSIWPTSAVKYVLVEMYFISLYFNFYTSHGIITDFHMAYINKNGHKFGWYKFSEILMKFLFAGCFYIFILHAHKNWIEEKKVGCFFFPWVLITVSQKWWLTYSLHLRAWQYVYVCI